MGLTLTNTNNVTDDATLNLQNTLALTNAVIGGTTFVFATGIDDDGVSVFSLNANGVLTNVAGGNINDNTTFAIGGPNAVTTAVIGGTTFLFVDGIGDNGVSVFTVSGAGVPSQPFGFGDNVFETDNAAVFELDGPQSLATAVVGGITFMFVASFFDDGISVFSVSGTGGLTNTDNITDDGTFELNGASSVTTAVVGGTTFLFVTGGTDDGVSVFSVAASGTLANVDNVTDSGLLELDGADVAATAVVGTKTFLFVAADVDDGISVFSVASNGDLTNVFNVTDNAALQLDQVQGLTTAKIAGTTYVFAAGRDDNGVSVFAVAADGTLINVANIEDSGAINLAGAISPSVAFVGGVPFLAVSGSNDNGISTFKINVTGNIINGTGGNDIINAVSSAPKQLLPSELGDKINGLGGNDTLQGLGGNDVLTGGNGRDIMFGNLGADRFNFDKVGESKVGGLRDRINDFKRGQSDKIDLKDIDAKTGGGNQAFTFIGKQDFNNVKGELRFEDKGSTVIVQGDRNGDGNADFEIFVKVGALGAGDFLL